MDPYYATGKFYDALVKIKDWETDDINDVAQKVQRSGHPEAYRDHEADGRVLASTLTGQSPAGFSCLDRSGTSGRCQGAAQFHAADVRQRSTTPPTDSVITIRASSEPTSLGVRALCRGQCPVSYGVTTVTIGNRSWQTQDFNLPDWQESDSNAEESSACEITVR